MKKITVKVPAKINLTLDILGVKEGYHELNSLVASIDVYDVVTAKKRADKRVTLTMKGLPLHCAVKNNNAYKTAKLFMETYSTCGVDLTIEKHIPISGGLGGSSADIAGVLNAMSALYEKSGIEKLASDMGSDATYMLYGGFAQLKGRGERIEKINSDAKLYLLLITDDSEISSRSCYKKYDEMNITCPSTTEQAKKSLLDGDLKRLFGLIKNDLQASSCAFCENITKNKEALKSVGAINALVAGSGPTVYGVFEGKKQMNIAYKKLSPFFGDRLIKAQTVTKKGKKFS